MGGQVGMINLSDLMGKAMGQQPRKKRKMRVADAWDKLIEEESDKRLDPDDVNRTALKDAEANGIVFLDEIDKIAVSRRARRLGLPRGRAARPAAADRGHHGRHQIRADEDRPYPVHRLGRLPRRQALDLLPELQGRLPIRVELKALTEEDFVRILSDTRASLTEQYRALLATEGVEIDLRRGRHPGARPHRRRGERPGREYRRPPPADRARETARGRQLRGRAAPGRDASPSTPPMSKRQLAEIARDTDLSKYVL